MDRTFESICIDGFLIRLSYGLAVQWREVRPHMTTDRVRFFIGVAVLLVLSITYSALAIYSDRLISKIEGVSFPVVILPLALLGGLCGYCLAAPLPSRLFKRLIFICVMAVTMFLGANIVRSWYSLTSFSSGPSRSTLNMAIISVGADSVELRSPFTGGSVSLPAAGDASRDTFRFLGRCVSALVETAPNGAKRIAPNQPVILLANAKSCDGGTIAGSGDETDNFSGNPPFARKERRVSSNDWSDSSQRASEEQIEQQN